MGRFSAFFIGVLLLLASATSVYQGLLRGSRQGMTAWEIKRSTNPLGFWAGVSGFAGLGLLLLWAAFAMGD